MSPGRSGALFARQFRSSFQLRAVHDTDVAAAHELVSSTGWQYLDVRCAGFCNLCRTCSNAKATKDILKRPWGPDAFETISP